MELKFISTLVAVVLTIVVITTTTTEAGAGNLKYEDCGSLLKSINISLTGCTDPPCILRKGKEYSYDFELTAISETSSKNISYVVQVVSFFIPISVAAGDACANLEEGTCPIRPGQQITFKAENIQIPENFPVMTTKVRAIATDDHNRVLGCVSTALKFM